MFFTHPLWFCFLYMLTDFAFGGALACLCMTFSYFIKGRVLALPIPFLLLLVWDHISKQLSGSGGYDLYGFGSAYGASGTDRLLQSGMWSSCSVIAGILVITALITAR